MAVPAPEPAAVCLVTGASSGIGAELARELAGRGHGVALTARRGERLEALARELRERDGVRAEALPGDLLDPAEPARLRDMLEERGLRVSVLVNNAGFGSEGRFDRLDAGHETDIVRLNAEAVVALCGLFVAPMVERRSGAVLNVASTAAFQPVPRMATYSASKAFVLSFSEALGEELRGSGVSVTALCPGPVATEFFKSSEIKGGVAQSPGWAMLSAEETARAGVEGMERGRRTVIPGRIHAAGAVGGRLLPRSLLLPVIRRFWPAPR